MGNTLSAIPGKATLLCLPQPGAVAGEKKPTDAAVTDSVCRADPAALSNESIGSLLVRRPDPVTPVLPAPVAKAGITVGGRNPMARPRVAEPAPTPSVAPADTVAAGNAPAIAANKIPGANDATLTAGFEPATQAAIVRVKSRPWTADIMVAHSATEAVDAFKAIVAKSPDLQSAARRNNISDADLALMLGTTAYSHGVKGAGTDMVLSIPRNPVFFAQMVMRKNASQGTEASLAAHAAQTLATHDIDYRVGHLHQSPAAATQGFAAAAAAGWQQLHASNPSEYPAFTRAAANDVNALVRNGYRNSASYNPSAYNPSDDVDYFEDYDFESPPVADPAISTATYLTESTQRDTERRAAADGPIGSVSETVRAETRAQYGYNTGVNLRRQHMQVVDQGRALRQGTQFRPILTRVI